MKPYCLEGSMTFMASPATPEHVAKYPEAKEGISIAVTYEKWRADAAGIGFVCGTLIKSHLDSLRTQVPPHELAAEVTEALREIHEAMAFAIARAVVELRGKMGEAS